MYLSELPVAEEVILYSSESPADMRWNHRRGCILERSLVWYSMKNIYSSPSYSNPSYSSPSYSSPSYSSPDDKHI